MELGAFQERFDTLRRGDPFLFEDHDPPATEDELESAEAKLGCRFGTKYRFLLRRYGGGSLGSCVLLSVHPSSDWSVVEENLAGGWLERGLLAFSPNLVGDYYLFPVKNARRFRCRTLP